MNKIKVNLFVGRFQPFTVGHLKCIDLAYNENKCPTIICMINNIKFDKAHPFSDELIEKEMNIIKQSNNHIKEIRRVKNGNIFGIVHFLNLDNYDVQMLITGTDRINNYTDNLNRARNNTDQTKNPFSENFKIFEIKRTSKDVSATQVRNSILNNNKETFIEKMPKGTDTLFDEFRQQLLKVNSKMTSIKEYLKDFFSTNTIKNLHNYIKD